MLQQLRAKMHRAQVCSQPAVSVCCDCVIVSRLCVCVGCRHVDCDVVMAEVRETSRKPDEMYPLLERLSPGTRKLEIFARPHNVRPGWVSMGNQLGTHAAQLPRSVLLLVLGPWLPWQMLATWFGKCHSVSSAKLLLHLD